jgi:hypothetical protein
MAGGTFDIDEPPVGFGNGAGDAETQTDALFISGARFGRSVKPVEDPLLLISGKAYSRVRDHQGCPIVIGMKG